MLDQAAMMSHTTRTVFHTLALSVAGLSLASAAPEDQPIYTGVIQKIVDAKCIACHTAEKKKGKLEMTNFETSMKGGESGKPFISAGKSAESQFVVRMLLPKDHDEHMPPENKPQPSAQEIEVIKWWIDSGAKPDTLVKDAAAPEALKPVVLELAAKTVEKPKEAPKPVITPKELDPATKEAVAKLSAELGSPILQLAQSDTGLMFTAVNVADKFGDAELAKFAPIAGSVADLNLARTKVTDAGIAALAGMKNLTRLRLENTSITDAAVDHLAGLEKLEYLNVYGTVLSDAGLQKLGKLKGLKRLYAWQTKVSDDCAKQVTAGNQELVINLGWDKEFAKGGAIAKAPPVPVASTPPPAAPAPAPAPKADDPEASFYAARIQPIFNAVCTGCHGAEKQKGKLRMDTFEAVLKGGEGGAGFVAGKSGESAIIKSMLLPLDDDDHMPPKNKKQPEPKDIELIKFWLDQAGADATKKIKDIKLPDNLK